MTHNISILIVLYNKTPFESQTFNSILRIMTVKKDVNLTIWNNGPYELSAGDKSKLKMVPLDIILVETLDNMSLSKIYNQFILENPSEVYVFLDDDSSLTDNYISHLYTKSDCVKVPIITSNGKIKFPHVDQEIYNSKIKISNKNKIVSITSGLIIGRSAVQLLLEHYDTVFDEKFYFYGVDTSFFHRCFSVGSKILVIPGFEHCLSIDKIENPSVKKFRRKEYSYAYGLFVRNYPSRPYWQHILAFILRNLFKKTKYNSWDVLKAFITNRHYRY